MNEREDKYAELKACLGMAAMMPCDPRTKQMLGDARRAIEELQAAKDRPTPESCYVPDGWNFERMEKSAAYPNGIRIDAPGDHHCIIDVSTKWPEHHPVKMLYRLAEALLYMQQKDQSQ